MTPGHPAMSKEAGYTLLEVIMAMAILSIGLLAVGYMQITAINSNTTGSRITEGTTLALGKMEELITLRYTHADLTAGNHPDPNPNDHPGFSQIWDVLDNNNGTVAVQNVKHITVTVSWAEIGRQRRTQLMFIKPQI